MRPDPLVVAGDVVLDCSGVTFFDSMGLRVAVTTLHQAAKAGTTFALVPSKPVTQVLALTEVDKIFTIYDALPQAAS